MGYSVKQMRPQFSTCSITSRLLNQLTDSFC